MGWFWAIFWVPAMFFMVSRVRRRMRYLGGGRPCMYRRHRHARRYRDYDDDDEDERDWDDFAARGFDQVREGFGRRRRGLLSGLFRRLDTTPGREKAIRGLLDQLGASLGDARSEFMGARRQLAAALEGELDGPALDAAFTRNGELFSKLSAELKAALRSLHDTLDRDQRKLLAELLSQGRWRGGPFGRHAYDL
jgi:hypothetical protein